MTIYREEIKANRIKWAEYLQQPERKKAKGQLSRGGEHRCCLGHGCEALGIEYFKFYGISQRLVEAVALYNASGATDSRKKIMNTKQNYLAGVNDTTKKRPQDIGAYLATVIEGGEDTPFEPLSDYPSKYSRKS